MHTIDTSTQRDALHPARAPQSRRPATLTEAAAWMLRDLGLRREVTGRSLAEHDSASVPTVMLRAFYGY